MKHAHWLLLAAFAAGNAVSKEDRRPDPADPQAPVPPPTYRSAFEGYRGFAEPKSVAWREANDAAARFGGHIGVLREPAKPEERK